MSRALAERRAHRELSALHEVVDGEIRYRARCRCGWIAPESRPRVLMADRDYRGHRGPTW